MERALRNGGAGGHRAAGAAGPGLQRAGSPQALSDRPEGVPGPAGPDERAGRGGPARRRGQADPGTQAKEPGEVGSRGAQRPAAGGPGGLQPEHAGAEQVRAGGARRLHREIATKALPDKRAETVTRAAAEIIPDLVQEEGNYVVTTDLGNEFQGLERRCPEGRCTGKRTPRTATPRRSWTGRFRR